MTMISWNVCNQLNKEVYYGNDHIQKDHYTVKNLRRYFSVKRRSRFPRHKNEQCCECHVYVIGGQNNITLVRAVNSWFLNPPFDKRDVVWNKKWDKLCVEQGSYWVDRNDSIYIWQLLSIINVSGTIDLAMSLRPYKHENHVWKKTTQPSSKLNSKPCNGCGIRYRSWQIWRSSRNVVVQTHRKNFVRIVKHTCKGNEVLHDWRAKTLRVRDNVCCKEDNMKSNQFSATI